MASSRSSLPRWARILLWTGTFFLFGLGVTAVWVYRTLHLSPEARTLKGAVLGAVERPVQSQLQFSAGAVLLTVAREVVAHVDDAPPEARDALRAVRAASVGIYDVGHSGPPEPATLADCDRRMQREGWHRAVAVRDGATTVLVYVPRGAGQKDLRVCIAVLDGEKHVLVSGRLDGEELLPLVDRQMRQLALR